MPVTVKKMGGKFRVVEAATGRIVTNNAGTPVDGGGKKSKARVSSQARAINSSLHKRGVI